MFRSTAIDFGKSTGLSRLVLEYLEGNERLRDLYEYKPDINSFREMLAARPYSAMDRRLLTEVLAAQSRRTDNCSEATVASIRALGGENCYTVTTGHQLCLFTGPLYFIYKILSVIRLAEKLGREFPSSKFVPVYWLAGEDHDFAEVNHLHVFGKRIEWPGTGSGAVGAMSTKGLDEVHRQLGEILGESEPAKALLSLFERAYLRHSTLADATRYLVNELFGKYGLVTADGNDAELKKQFRNEFRKDILEGAVAPVVNGTIAKLESLGYEAQVKPREVNVFLLRPGLRARIERKEKGFGVTGTDIVFTRAEMEELIENHPEQLSPNVTLRPVYQQRVLPNLAYVGGPGEIAYWLEYREMFSGLGAFYPLLALRDSFTIIDSQASERLEKLKLEAVDLFRAEDELMKELQVRSNNYFSIDSEKEELSAVFAKLVRRVAETDPSLEANANAELQKALKALDSIAGKANRALRQKSDAESGQLKNLRSKVLPAGLPQERFENFSSFYLKHGGQFFEDVLEHCEGMTNTHKILLG
jgi:bacillithiol synthase